MCMASGKRVLTSLPAEQQQSTDTEDRLVDTVRVGEGEGEGGRMERAHGNTHATICQTELVGICC